MSRDVPDGWEVKSLKTMINLTTGFPFKSNQFNDDAETGTPVVRIRDLTAQSPSIFTAEPFEMRYLVKHGDYLIGMDGEFSAIKWEGLDAALNQRVLKLSSSSSELDSEFLYYRIQPELTMIHGRTGATTVKHLSTKDLLSLEISLPPLYEQHRIAEILSSVDDAIAATQAVIEQTKTVKQATLERLLTKGIGHTRFKQTEIGEIPESWDFAELNSVATLQPGYAFKSNQFVDEGVRLLRGSNVGVGSFDWSEGTTKYFPKDRVVEFSEYFLRENDIIIAMDRPFISSGFKVARLQKSDLPCLLLQRVGRLTPKVNCDPDWLWQITSAGSVRSHLEKQQVGTDLPHISKSDIESCKIAIPTLSEQKAIASILTPFDVNIEILMKNLHTSKSMKSALMSDLLTGRKRVTDTLPLAAE